MKRGNRKKRQILAVLVLIFCMGIAVGREVLCEKTDGTMGRDAFVGELEAAMRRGISGSIFNVAAGSGLSVRAAAEETTGAGDSEEYLSGKSLDIQLSRLKVKGSQAGARVTLSFDISGMENTAEKYEVDQIEKVWINSDADSFPFVSEDETYKIVSGSGKSLSCSWKLRLKEDLSTGYYKANFYVLYRRKAMAGNSKKYDSLYRIEKSVDIRVQGSASKEEAVSAENGDISVKMKNSPHGTYSGSCPVSFQVKSRKYTIKSVVPVVDEKFPFQGTSEAYKVIYGKGKSLDCRYDFRVKDDVKTGYEWVSFDVYYEKDGQEVKLTKKIGVQLTGKKKEKTEKKTEEKKVSVPRLMVTGRTFDREKIYPGDQFRITLQVRNTSDAALRNIKYTVSSGKGEFVSADGINSAFLSSVSAHGTSEITFFLEASSDLTAKPYQLCAFAEYEDSRVNRYEATDYVTIPITVQDRISITDIRKPEKLTVGTDGDLTLSVNNVGENTVRNVTVRLEGEDFRAQKAFVGKLAGSSSGYADLYVQGVQRTSEGSGKNAKIIVSYVSSSGQKKSCEKEVRIVVKEEVPEDLKALSQETDMEEAGTLPKQVIALLIAALCIVGCGVFLKYRKG